MLIAKLRLLQMLTSLLALNFLGTSTRVKEHRGLSTCFCRFRPLRFPNPLTLTARFTEPQAPNTGRIGEDLKILLQFLLSKSKRHSQIVSSRSKNSWVNKFELNFILRDSGVCLNSPRQGSHFPFGKLDYAEEN